MIDTNIWPATYINGIEHVTVRADDINSVQDKLALAQLDNARLREALRKAVIPKRVKAGGFDVVPSDELISEDEVNELLSAPPRQQPLKRLSEDDVRKIIVSQNNSTLIEDCLPEELQNLANAIMDEIERINK